MGSSVQWNQDQGTLEPGRKGNKHKLLGAVSNNLGSTDLLEGTNSSVSTIIARQTDATTWGGQLTQLAKDLWM